MGRLGQPAKHSDAHIVVALLEGKLLTRILQNTFGATLLVAAALTMAGCPTGLATAIPGMAGASAAPSAAPAATTPAAGGGSTTAPAASGPGACSRTEPSLPKITGNASMGEYNGQGLPNGYDTYDTEAEVTAAIRKEDGGENWNCFQKFYPGATTVYKKNK